MKSLRILAAILAMMMLGSFCLADEAGALQAMIDGLIADALGMPAAEAPATEGLPIESAPTVGPTSPGAPIGSVPVEIPVEIPTETEDDSDIESIDIPLYSATLLPLLETTAAEWMAGSDIRALFSVLFLLELYDVNEVDVEGMVDELGIPTCYVATPSYGYSSEAIMGVYFFGGESSGTYVLAIYEGADGTYSGFTMPYYSSPASVMQSFDDGDFFNSYYEIPAGDFYTAVTDLNEIFSN